MKLTPFHSDSIWETYDGLRPRSKTPYKKALLKAIDGCIAQDIKNPRILVLGAGPGTYDVDLLFDVLTERQLTPVGEKITVIDWHRHKSLNNEVKFIKQDIEEFLAGTSEGPFDIVVAFLVVHHLVNWRLAIANIARVASGGFLVFDEYECMKAGWIDWIDGTTGFVGLDLQLPQTDAAGKWAAFFRDYYSQLDKNHGLFWEPEVRGTDYKRLHRALTYSGFHDLGNNKEDIAGNFQYLSAIFKALDNHGNYQDPARLFSQFAWGSKIGGESYLKQFIAEIPEDKSYAFIKELFKSEGDKRNFLLEDSNQAITFTIRVNTYEIPKAKSLPEVANRLAETYWFEGFHDALFHRLLLLHIEELSTDQSIDDEYEYEKLQRKKLVQYLIFSGGFTQSLVFAAPVLMTINKISNWETVTSKKSILVVNDASEKKDLLNGHLKRMASFAKYHSERSLTESFLNLRLPISIVFRVKEKAEPEITSQNVSLTLHNLHTGKLVEVAIPEDILGEDNCRCEDINLSIDLEWCFSRFRAGVLAGLNDSSKDVCKHADKVLAFEWEENGNSASDKARRGIEVWVNKTLPFLAPLLKQHIRAVIIGLYHVRVDDRGHDGYGGLGSVFLAENITGKLTEFDIERFRFMQAEAQKFSSIYMFESLRKTISSGEALSKQKRSLEEANANLKKFETMMSLLQKPLDNLTRTLDETQQDTQELRAILYDPHLALFSVASLVAKYFEELREHNIGNVKWRSTHGVENFSCDLNDRVSQEKIRIFKNTISAIILHVYGKANASPLDDKELWNLAAAQLQNTDSSFEQLTDLLAVVGITPPLLLSAYECKNLLEVFLYLKWVLFKPYKDAETEVHILPLLILVYGINKGKGTSFSLEDGKTKQKVESSLSKAFNTASVKGAWLCTKITDQDGIHGFIRLPVPRYSHLLAFIGGVLSYCKGEKKSAPSSLEIITNNNNSAEIKLTWPIAVFEVQKLDILFNKMCSLIVPAPSEEMESGGIRYSGNFRKPFLDFADRCRSGEPKPKCCSIKNENQEVRSISIDHDSLSKCVIEISNDRCLKISFSQDEIS